MKNRRFKSVSCDQAVFECERLAVADWQQKKRLIEGYKKRCSESQLICGQVKF